jgi:hypothetical protein
LQRAVYAEALRQAAEDGVSFSRFAELAIEAYLSGRSRASSRRRWDFGAEPAPLAQRDQ